MYSRPASCIKAGYLYLFGYCPSFHVLIMSFKCLFKRNTLILLPIGSSLPFINIISGETGGQMPFSENPVTHTWGRDRCWGFLYYWLCQKYFKNIRTNGVVSHVIYRLQEDLWLLWRPTTLVKMTWDKRFWALFDEKAWDVLGWLMHFDRCKIWKPLKMMSCEWGYFI